METMHALSTWGAAYAVACSVLVWSICGALERRGPQKMRKDTVRIGAERTHGVPSERLLASLLGAILVPLALLCAIVAAGVILLMAPLGILAWHAQTEEEVHKTFPLLFPKPTPKRYGAAFLHRIIDRIDAHGLFAAAFFAEAFGPLSLLCYKDGTWIHTAAGILIWTAGVAARIPELKETLRLRRALLRLQRDPELRRSELQAAAATVRCRAVAPNPLRNEPPDPADEELLEAYQTAIAVCRGAQDGLRTAEAAAVSRIPRTNKWPSQHPSSGWAFIIPSTRRDPTGISPASPPPISAC